MYLEENVMNINLKEDIKPISYIKTNAADMIDYINDHKNPIIVTQHGEAGGLLDIESYQNMVNALSIMKLLQISERSIQGGKVYDNEEVFSSLRAKIGLKNG
jgi:PHD/YefM family antitoxin component YafN of YafNO toxin-antitoxin module